ncbi:hypothetical protein K491DRAFT_623922 [Lophiostoma macrostomum CBS 122681]|uniref:Utp8 beta-propeller domain-containing protein n=1 Tax=Lophiostoma macrostomum CBS 122681 TaxID=1314788 RepID=A0A6A6THG6_9PLEO|nr:hypothetical protein K491DRAFT_623922 [Lophiostoma macrostomum CBS 122681]
MSSTAQIGAPFTLASIPKPINAGGRTQASAVCSITGTKKRKRSEIAVGVDGEGISVYSLQNPQLVTSYALPPETSFTIAPHCLYRKRSKTRTSIRFTYAAVAATTLVQSPHVLCFREEIYEDGTTETTKSMYTLPNQEDPIRTIESLPVAGSSDAEHATHDILLVLADGQIRCLSSDLKTRRWTYLIHGIETRLGVELAVVTTAKAAMRGLLRNRQDIASILDPTLGGKPELLSLTPIICVISRRTGSQRELNLWQIQPRSPDVVSTRMLMVKHLVTMDFPAFKPVADDAKRTQDFYLHPSTGILHQLTNGHIDSFNFSTTVPTRYSDLNVPGANLESVLRVSTDLLLASLPGSVGLFDVQHAAIQSLLPLKPNATPTGDSKKRKHGTPDHSLHTAAAPTLVSFFAEIGLAVAIVNHEIVGFQLAEGVSRKRKKNSTTLLIDAIGKGLPAIQTKDFAHRSQSGHAWQRKFLKLDKCALKGDVLKFEQHIASDLGLTPGTTSIREDNSAIVAQIALANGNKSPLRSNSVTEDMSVSHERTAAHTNGGSEDGQLQRWEFPDLLVTTQRHQFRHIAIYALSKIFSWDPFPPQERNSNSRLRIDFFPPNVFQWLLLSGYITKEYIRRSLVEYGPDSVKIRISLTDGDLTKAIVEFDPELHILSAVLNQSHFLPAGEVVQAIRVLMQNLDDPTPTGEMSKYLTNGNVAEDEMDVDIGSELDAATHDLDHALTMLNNGPGMRSHSIRPALIRLHTFPSSVVSTMLRSILSRTELNTLIRVLHSEFRNGGWTSPYDFMDVGASTEFVTDGPDDQAVAIIASLLSCALDAIGASAWLSPSANFAREDTTEDMVQDLLHDTSEALNGFWESRYIKGLLSEFLRYASNLGKSQKPTVKSLQDYEKPFAVDIATSETLPMLPLGGKVDLGVEKMKTGKGGKREERSAREIGMIISKRVPKYSLEKISI